MMGIRGRMYDLKYRSQVIDRMLTEGLSPEALAKLLEREEMEEYGRRMVYDGNEAIEPQETPSGKTIQKWVEESEWVILWREQQRTGPVTSVMFRRLCDLLGWEDGEAAMRFGADTALIHRWRYAADPPSYVAAHVRTILEVMVGRLPGIGKVKRRQREPLQKLKPGEKGAKIQFRK